MITNKTYTVTTADFSNTGEMLEQVRDFPKSRDGLTRSEEHTSELQSRLHLVCRLLLEKKKNQNKKQKTQTTKNKKKKTTNY